MDMGALPPFWLAYLSDPSDSGRIHSNIRQRWLSGRSSRRGSDPDVLTQDAAESRRPPSSLRRMCERARVFTGDPLVVEAMRTFAELTDGARLV